MSAPSFSFPLFLQNTWTASNPHDAAVQPLRPVSIQRLVRLLDESGDDDYGKLGPSQTAFKNAILLVMNAIDILGEDVPSSPVVDSQGGIRVTWRHGNKQVKLVCPATPDAAIYIYHASPEGNDIRNQNVTATVLAERLAWLADREPAKTS